MKSDLDNEIGILLVEDNPADIRLVQEVFKEARIHNKMHVALNGEKAMQLLHRESEYAHISRPDLIILDLNLPKKDGKEVLKEIKEDESLKTIPVVILTTSNAEDDLIDTYKNNANCYITKPVDLDNFIKVVKIIENFWLSVVKLPPHVD